MSGAILVLNTGSSSVRVAAYEAGAQKLAAAPFLRGHISGIGARLEVELHDGAGHPCVLQRAFEDTADRNRLIQLFLGEIGAHLEGRSLLGIGHRIVHGGPQFVAPQILDEGVIDTLTKLSPLAPSHQPFNLFGVEAARRLWPDLRQVGCFDTAFHRTQPALAQMFAIPREMTQRGLIRYGFHGLSYAYIARVLPEYLGPLAQGRVVVAHLGHGASLCGMRERKSVATTMGFTALDGLPMGTRCGAIDPGLLLYLLTQEGMSAQQVEELLYKKSGLLGVSGVSCDMRDLLDSDDPDAGRAIDLFAYRIARETGSLAAALGGLDALIFTAGIGEHAAPVRARVCAQLSWLGIALDEQANAADKSCITSSASHVPVHVIATDEEQMIALDSFDALKG